VDFDVRPVHTFQARAGSLVYGGMVEIHLDAPDGERIGACTAPRTSGWRKWPTVSCPIQHAKGVRAVYLVFKGTGRTDPSRLFDLESFWFAAR
jgi:hypothetical protein